MELGLAGKVALVTASSKGLGRVSALALSQEGAKVVCFLCSEPARLVSGTALQVDGVATTTGLL